MGTLIGHFNHLPRLVAGVGSQDQPPRMIAPPRPNRVRASVPQINYKKGRESVLGRQKFHFSQASGKGQIPEEFCGQLREEGTGLGLS